MFYTSFTQIVPKSLRAFLLDRDTAFQKLIISYENLKLEHENLKLSYQKFDSENQYLSSEKKVENIPGIMNKKALEYDFKKGRIVIESILSSSKEELINREFLLEKIKDYGCPYQ